MILTNKKTSVGIDVYGGNITSYQYNGKHIFFPHQMVLEKEVLKERGRTHDCFPNFGTALFDPRYKLPQHGLIRNTQLACVRGEKAVDPFDETPDLVDKVLPYFNSKYQHNADEIFPFNFIFESNIIVNSGHFSKSVKVKRLPGGLSDPMPYSYGLHTYLNTSIRGNSTSTKITCQNQSFELRAGKFPDDEVKTFSHEPNSTEVVMINIRSLGTIIMKVGGLGELDHWNLVLWGGDSDYLCVEPVVGKYDQNLFLEENQEFNIWFEFSIQ